MANDELLDRLELFKENWNRSRTQLQVHNFDISGLTIAKRNKAKEAKLLAEKTETVELQE